MNPLIELANAHPGFGAAPFRRAVPPSPQSSAPFMRTPLPASPPSGPSAPVPPPLPIVSPQPPIQSASQSLREAQIEQAQPPVQSARPDYQWAVLNQDVWIGGHKFPAGTHIVVALSQPALMGGGKAHTTSIGVKAWVKFGQTFDSSSWISGAVPTDAFTLTGQSATWGSAGFGAPIGRVNTGQQIGRVDTPPTPSTHSMVPPSPERARSSQLTPIVIPSLPTHGVPPHADSGSVPPRPQPPPQEHAVSDSHAISTPHPSFPSEAPVQGRSGPVIPHHGLRGLGDVTPGQAAAAGGGLGFVGGLIIGGLIGGIATATVMYLAEQKEQAIYRRAGYSGR